MSRIKVLVILTALLINACSVNEPSKFMIAEVDGFKIKTSSIRVVSYKAYDRTFLRIIFNTFDLVLDSRIQAHTEADFMSIISAGYGNGKLELLVITSCSALIADFMHVDTSLLSITSTSYWHFINLRPAKLIFRVQNPRSFLFLIPAGLINRP